MAWNLISPPPTAATALARCRAQAALSPAAGRSSDPALTATRKIGRARSFQNGWSSCCCAVCSLFFLVYYKGRCGQICAIVISRLNSLFFTKSAPNVTSLQLRSGNSNSDGTEEIIIPLGGEMDLGGLGGGGSTFEIPLDPSMMLPPQVQKCKTDVDQILLRMFSIFIAN